MVAFLFIIMANQGDNCRYYIRIYIGGVNLFYTRLTAEHSSSIEWLPWWGKFIFHSHKC